MIRLAPIAILITGFQRVSLMSPSPVARSVSWQWIQFFFSLFWFLIVSCASLVLAGRHGGGAPLSGRASYHWLRLSDPAPSSSPGHVKQIVLTPLYQCQTKATRHSAIIDPAEAALTPLGDSEMCGNVHAENTIKMRQIIKNKRVCE